MTGENINIPLKPLRILISPLHWGLGHATRIIPVIKILQAAGVEVILAAVDAPAALLQKEFPHLQIIPTPALQLNYPQKGKWFFLKMLTQAPSLLVATQKEKNWLGKLVAENRIDAVISDNRFGLSSTEIPCVFITHQLFINAPRGILRWLSGKINYFYINRFSECWVPDLQGSNNLAGKLSHPGKLPSVPVHYLGPLSRLKKGEKDVEHILIILSGPEPQRSIWEKQLMNQVQRAKQKIILVRGLPEVSQMIEGSDAVTIYNHADEKLMNELINTASVVISRSGYSTIMDIIAVRKKAILVPTPGQAEQEYLAEYLSERQVFLSFSQDEFDIKNALETAASFQYRIPDINFEELNKRLITDWLNRLRKSDG